MNKEQIEFSLKDFFSNTFSAEKKHWNYSTEQCIKFKEECKEIDIIISSGARPWHTEQGHAGFGVNFYYENNQLGFIKKNNHEGDAHLFFIHTSNTDFQAQLATILNSSSFKSNVEQLTQILAPVLPLGKIINEIGGSYACGRQKNKAHIGEIRQRFADGVTFEQSILCGRECWTSGNHCIALFHDFIDAILLTTHHGGGNIPKSNSKVTPPDNEHFASMRHNLKVEQGLEKTEELQHYADDLLDLMRQIMQIELGLKPSAKKSKALSTHLFEKTYAAINVCLSGKNSDYFNMLVRNCIKPFKGEGCSIEDLLRLICLRNDPELLREKIKKDLLALINPLSINEFYDFMERAIPDSISTKAIEKISAKDIASQISKFMPANKLKILEKNQSLTNLIHDLKRVKPWRESVHPIVRRLHYQIYSLLCTLSQKSCFRNLELFIRNVLMTSFSVEYVERRLKELLQILNFPEKDRVGLQKCIVSGFYEILEQREKDSLEIRKIWQKWLQEYTDRGTCHISDITALEHWYETRVDDKDIFQATCHFLGAKSGSKGHLLQPQNRWGWCEWKNAEDAARITLKSLIPQKRNPCENVQNLFKAFLSYIALWGLPAVALLLVFLNYVPFNSSTFSINGPYYSEKKFAEISRQAKKLQEKTSNYIIACDSVQKTDDSFSKGSFKCSEQEKKALMILNENTINAMIHQIDYFFPVAVAKIKNPQPPTILDSLSIWNNSDDNRQHLLEIATFTPPFNVEGFQSSQKKIITSLLLDGRDALNDRRTSAVEELRAQLLAFQFGEDPDQVKGEDSDHEKGENPDGEKLKKYYDDCFLEFLKIVETDFQTNQGKKSWLYNRLRKKYSHNQIVYKYLTYEIDVISFILFDEWNRFTKQIQQSSESGEMTISFSPLSFKLSLQQTLGTIDRQANHLPVWNTPANVGPQNIFFFNQELLSSLKSRMAVLNSLAEILFTLQDQVQEKTPIRIVVESFHKKTNSFFKQYRNPSNIFVSDILTAFRSMTAWTLLAVNNAKYAETARDHFEELLSTPLGNNKDLLSNTLGITCSYSPSRNIITVDFLDNAISIIEKQVKMSATNDSKKIKEVITQLFVECVLRAKRLAYVFQDADDFFKIDMDISFFDEALKKFNELRLLTQEISDSMEKVKAEKKLFNLLETTKGIIISNKLSLAHQKFSLAHYSRIDSLIDDYYKLLIKLQNNISTE